MTVRYIYTDADGNPLFAKVRGEDKQFGWERYADGTWVPGRGGQECPLYNLPAVIKAAESGDFVWVVEGEKDADRLAAMGEVATTNPDGAGHGKWLGSYTRALAGAHVRIIADRDNNGYDHAQAVYRDLLSTAKSVRILEADVDTKGADVSDHLDAGLPLKGLLPVEPDVAPGLPRAPAYPVEALEGPLRKFTDWAVRDGLHAEAAGPAALAALAAVCGDARLDQPFRTTPSLWLTIIGSASSGKSPAMRLAFEQIDKRNERIARENTARRAAAAANGGKADTTAKFTGGNQTPEALIRDMNKSGGAYAVVVDELDSFLSSMGAYSTTKRGGDAERARFREMWSGRPVDYSRVGQGGAANQVEINIAEPVLTIFGPLLPADVWKLGGVTNGDWARWLPAAVPPEVPDIPETRERKPREWTEAMTQLMDLRGCRRYWQLRDYAFREYKAARDRWTRERYDAPEHVSQALMKAGEQVLRIALVLAEAQYPGHGGNMPVSVIRSAVALMDYHIGVWRSLPGERSVLTSREGWAELNAVTRLMHWLQQRPKDPADGIRKATRREIMRARVAGVKTADDVDRMIGAYAEEYPGTLRVVKNPRGRPTVYLTEPVTTDQRSEER